MREFVLHSRTGRTDGNFRNMVDGGRLDTVHQCALMALFKSGAHRNDVVLHVILNGGPNPPVHLAIRGDELRDARVDERSWEEILRNVLSGKRHQGISVDKLSLQRLVEQKKEAGFQVLVLSDEGNDISETEISENVLFVLGDHVGLPKKDEGFVLRHGEKLSLGKEKYLAASCIDIINYTLDRNE